MKIINIDIGSKAFHYDIKIKRNIKDEIVGFINNNFYENKVAIITDSNLCKLYGDSIIKHIAESSKPSIVITIPAGEKSKSIHELMHIYEELAAFNMTRSDLIISFGGGVVGDITGFAASTYLRGVPYIQVPSSLLAQVDSSIGGKTAIDLPHGKNLAGSFYHPLAVFIDPELLNTLDAKYIKDGLVEVIKYGCIKDLKLFEKLKSYNNIDEMLKDVENIIYTCCSIKRSVVETDEKDTSERMLLNFGHTLGHSIEKYFNFEGYTHGEAVAIGMAEITRKSEALGITRSGTAKEIEALLRCYGLADRLPDVDRNKIIENIKLDKKSSGNTLNLILLKGIGEGIIKKIDIKDLQIYF